jgi:hypothetical protein
MAENDGCFGGLDTSEGCPLIASTKDGFGIRFEVQRLRLIDPRISRSCGLSGYSCLSQRAAILPAESARRLARVPAKNAIEVALRSEARFQSNLDQRQAPLREFALRFLNAAFGNVPVR